MPFGFTFIIKDYIYAFFKRMQIHWKLFLDTDFKIQLNKYYFFRFM